MEIDKLNADTDRSYTSELKKVLTFISKDLIDDYPTKKITTEYFILSLLNVKQCLAYKVLNRIMHKENLDTMYDFFARYVHDNAQQIQQKNDKLVGYDALLSKHITTNASIEKDALNDPKISSEHVFLSILNTGGTIKSQIESFGVTYKQYLEEINNIRLEEIKKNESDRALSKSISGFEPTKNGKRSGIESYCVNLNKLARQGKIDNLIGRETEINRVIKILGRRNKNNVIFVGMPGVGKTAISQGLANIIENGRAMFLNGKTILSLNMTSVIAGTTYRGMLEERMNSIINEVKENKDYILFIDDIHTVLGGASNNSSEISGILSNALSDGDIQLIATTSFKEYKNTIENNASLNRRFQKIVIEPTTIEETERILLNSKNYYENYHNVSYSTDAIKACVMLANKHITERQLPDSAIDILDECGSEKKVYNPQLDDLFELKKELDITEKLRDKSMKMNDFSLGDKYNKQAKEIKSKIIDHEKKVKSEDKTNRTEITENDIYITVSEMTGIPLNKLSVSEKQKYLNIENVLNKSIIGQEDVIKKVTQTIKRNRMGLDRKNKPTGVFLCIGESGVGKTLLAKKLAEEIYGGENMLVRFDMSEYSDKTSVNKLYGSNPGYIGFENGGQLTEAIKNKKHCVLLLDEIEKADSEVYNVFLQIFDDASLTDNSGQKVSFKNVIVIMTSNIGAKRASSLGRSSGFVSNTDENKKNITEKALKEHFPPEFLNRLDSIVYFNSLTDENFKDIIKLEMNALTKRLNEIEYNINFDDSAIEYLFNMINIDKSPGARKINRVIQTEIENKICDLYLENEYENGYTFKIEVINNKIEIN